MIYCKNILVSLIATSFGAKSLGDQRPVIQDIYIIVWLQHQINVVFSVGFLIPLIRDRPLHDLRLRASSKPFEIIMLGVSCPCHCAMPIGLSGSFSRPYYLFEHISLLS